jgi:hypothetical protein
MKFDWRKTLDKLWPALVAALLTALGVPICSQVSGCRGGTCPPAPPPSTKPVPPAPEPPDPTPPAEPIQAIGQVRMKGGYCSGTVVGPPRTDKHWIIVSAAHCFKGVGEKVTFVTRSGRGMACSVVAIDRRADGAILITDDAQSDMPWVKVAMQTPPVGSAIWHAGYGVHNPKNVEQGKVLAAPNSQGQTRYRLSVSQGDSGGGIMFNDKGELLSPVCCTTRLSGLGDVWGASPEVVQRMLAAPTEFNDELPPVQMPPPPKVP